jgi:chromosome segregation ATPase
MLAKEYKTEIMGLNNWIAAYKGQIDALKHELSVTKHHFDQLRYGPPPEPFSGQIAALARELADLQAAHTETVKQLQEQITQLQASNEALKQDAVEHTKAKDLARELRHRIRRRLAASIGMG